MEQVWSKERLEEHLPELSSVDYVVTSRADKRYNCVAWAAGSDRHWWQPDRYWPLSDRSDESTVAYIRAFASLGYEECTSSDLEPGFEKVVLYESSDGLVEHAARQLPNGRWTSKLGKLQDIEHGTPEALHVIFSYGRVAAILKRPREWALTRPLARTATESR